MTTNQKVNPNLVYVADRLIALIFSSGGLAYLWLDHPTDGTATLAIVMVLAGMLTALNSALVSALVKDVIPALVPTPAVSSASSASSVADVNEHTFGT